VYFIKGLLYMLQLKNKTKHVF